MIDALQPEDSSACPLTLVRSDGLASLLNGLSASAAQYVKASGFSGEPGTFCLLPDEQGRLAGVLAGINSVDDPHLLGGLPLSLPPGRYRLAADGQGVAIDPAQAALSWGLGAYQFLRYRSARREPAQLCLAADVLAPAQTLLAAVYQVRDLVNTPTQDLGPAELAEAAGELASRHGGRLRVIEGDVLLQDNFPAIHAVGRASHRAPRLIELDWGDDSHPRLALVGKGVCFDTGGLDLKSADGMLRMKKDMGGAAHALGLAELVMANTLPVRLKVLIPAVENAIGPDAFRPGEVIATRQGLSVEIGNTDAEGRLVLCDALTYAAQWQPELVLDFATLTGAARIALGPDLPGLYVNDETLATQLLDAAADSADPLWRMPLYGPYMSYLDSPIADINNAASSRHAGSITAALFLSRFVPEGLPWAHLDVYSWNDANRPGRPAGGEAQGLRAFYRMLATRYGRGGD
ncbi:MAG: leucyl aminopeptidase family protein [Xanthomonadales bacterium]|nr:leucyl aminopeptidase family protein [Xanthomonadales bacterium]